MTPETYIETVLPKMEGWCSPEKAACIVRLVKEKNAKMFMEIGVFGGRSLFAAALALPAAGVAIGIDPWCKSDSAKGFSDANLEWWQNLDHDQIYNECRRLQAALDLESNCYLVRANSEQAFAMVSRFCPIDILHIDGNHSEESSCFDVENYVPLVPVGGSIIFDDCDWPSTKLAITKLETMAEKVSQVGNCLFFTRK